MSDQKPTEETSESGGHSQMGKSTRRTFFSRLGMAGLLVSTQSCGLVSLCAQNRSRRQLFNRKAQFP